MDKFPSMDIVVMAAAVADYTPAKPVKKKIKKKNENLQLELVRTKDILKSMGKMKSNGQILVGFALEKEDEKEYALDKLKNKNADIIVLNSLNDDGAGFGFDTNKITIFEKGGRAISYAKKPKQEVAKDIVDRIANMIYA
jgi:phosphopantothenoylcysteine decarboxylase/phosphopantothenate--cysteine ligase